MTLVSHHGISSASNSAKGPKNNYCIGDSRRYLQIQAKSPGLPAWRQRGFLMLITNRVCFTLCYRRPFESQLIHSSAHLLIHTSRSNWCFYWQSVKVLPCYGLCIAKAKAINSMRKGICGVCDFFVVVEGQIHKSLRRRGNYLAAECCENMCAPFLYTCHADMFQAINVTSI